MSFQGYNPTQNVPYSVEAEEAVLSAVMINQMLFTPLAEILRPDDFFLVRNTEVWSAMMRLSQHAEPIDLLTVTNELRVAGKLDAIGGDIYLYQLVRNEGSTINADAYARIISVAAMRRRLMHAGDMIKQLATADKSFDDVIAECENAVYEATRRHTLSRTWEFVSRNELVMRPPIEWLIPRVLPVRSLGMIFGPSGSYKSFYALGLSVDVGQRADVLYVVAEGESGMPSRLQAHEQHFKQNTQRLTFCIGAIDMFSDADLTAFKRLSARYRPALIVVDTFAMCTGDADENSARDMKKIVDGCKRMISELGCAVLIVHHTNKEGKQERGSQAIRNACDTVIRLTLLDDVIRVEHQKSKDKALPLPQLYRRVVVNLGYKDSLNEDVTSVVLEPSERVIEDAALTVKQQAVLQALFVEPTASMSDIADIIESTRNAAHSIVTALTRKGYLAAWNGESREVTELGCAALGESTESGVSAAHSEKISQKNTTAQATQPDSRHTPFNGKSTQPTLFESNGNDYFKRGH